AGVRVEGGSALVFIDNTVIDNDLVDMLFAGGSSALEGEQGIAGSVCQTGGQVLLVGTFGIDELFKLEGGTFLGATTSTLNVQEVQQTGGFHGANNYFLNVVGEYRMDGGSTLLAGTGTLAVGG